MLILTVRPREFVQVGDNIKVYNPNAESIRIGFDAPREVHIVRPDAKDKTPKKA